MWRYIVLLAFTAASMVNIVRCDPSEGYTLLSGIGYYKFNCRRSTWHEASETCTEEGAHLAIVDSQDEMDALMREWSVYPWQRNPWVGVYRTSNMSDWITVQGNSLGNYTGWGEGYPKNEGNCVFLHAMQAAIFNVDCTLRGQFLCEYDLEDVSIELEQELRQQPLL
ncbi:hemolymph lipopolysaccharide-binding protein [Anabrus simplex]|uniref:hemolymph lipopolysaccharide-binding protein n=1 Tax=Anabrus simplex TaxID=316456 RepID=UPI0035A2A34F